MGGKTEDFETEDRRKEKRKDLKRQGAEDAKEWGFGESGLDAVGTVQANPS
jgi:hypothetical protein